MPGGCNFGGVRPIDQHVKGFTALGAGVTVEGGFIHASTENGRLKGANIYLDVVSVGATMNIMMAAVMAEGNTVIENAAKEPHIVDLANFLNSMGANIRGAGTDTIKIHGVDRLRGGSYAIIPDQIEAGTYMAAVAATGGQVLVKNIIPKHMDCITAKLVEMRRGSGGARGYASWCAAPLALQKANVKTLPYPGFPTDMQPQITAVLCLAQGTSLVTESVWNNRYRYVDELKRMGAQHPGGRQDRRGRRCGSPDRRSHPGLRPAGRCRAWSSPRWPPRVRARSAACSISSAATRTSLTSCGLWAPISVWWRNPEKTRSWKPTSADFCFPLHLFLPFGVRLRGWRRWSAFPGRTPVF